MTNTPTTIARKFVPSFVGTAAGAADMTREEVVSLSDQLSFITLKSTTLDHREGNAEPRYKKLPYGTIQSMGLPNIGLARTLDCVRQIARPGLSIIASIAGKSAFENQELMWAFQCSQVNFVEINYSCPNKVGEKIIAFDLDQMDEVLGYLTNLGDKPVGIKLPYYGNVEIQKRLSDILVKHNISFITCINGIPGLEIDVKTERTVIKPNNGKGAIGGKYIQPFALLEVRNYYEILKGTGISIIGVGGIDCGEDVFKFLLAGADAVQVGSTLQEQGPTSVQRINNEFAEILKLKNYKTAQAAKGKLLSWNNQGDA
jgi:dihydroorotate dehydrogenase (fumarate)